MNARNTRRRILTTLTVGVLLVPGCDQPNQFAPPPPPKVTVSVPAVREVAASRAYPGRAEAVESVEVHARVQGFLEAVHFEPGVIVSGPDADDPESTGDLLFTIERAPFEAAAAAARAQVAQQEAARDLAQITRDRMQDAHSSGGVSDLEFAQSEAELAAAEAAVDAAEAALQQAEIDLGYTLIHAPITGHVSRESVDVGNLVGTFGSTLLTTVVRDDSMYAYFEVSERELLEYIKQGRKEKPPEEERKGVELQLADGSLYEAEGILDFVEPRVDPTSGTLQARAIFPNQEGKLYPGLFVRVILSEDAAEHMLVPESAVQRDLSGAFVMTIDDKNIVQRRVVEIGERIGNERIVLGGIEPTDRVIVNGIQRAVPGNPVDPSPAQAPGATNG